ncbi:MAG: SDR family oxidoreductase [Candidatus Devosia symbiotica]|nr:SDR family oxidoreductase [Candidatus Devosia symbiotica]
MITGAGGLLGWQHGAALAEIGAALILTDINIAAAEAAAQAIQSAVPGAQVNAFVLDVTSLDAITDLGNASGQVDILVNNAAIDPKVTSSSGVAHASRLEVFTRAQWDLEIAVGLTGAMQCAQIFGAKMAKRGSGAILNIASDLGVIAPDQRLYRPDPTRSLPSDPVKPVTYSVIKHGLIGLTKYLATYWAEHGVRVNALSPGGVFNNQNAEFVQRLTNLIPMGRMADVGEYRAAVQFLCSDASRYMTGQNLVIDGGRSAW